LKILVMNNSAPFVHGGAEELARNLVRQLEVHGHEAELVRIPFAWEPYERIPAQMLMVKWIELFNVDHVIALKFPAYLVEHPSKSLWVLHQYRQAYDLFDQGMSNIPDDVGGRALRTAIRRADDEAFASARGVFVNSRVTQQRMVEYNALLPEILLPPVNDPDRFHGGEFGEYVFVGGRVNALKRQELAVQAIRHADPRVRLVIAGPPDSQNDRDSLTKLVETEGVADRVLLDLRMLPRDEYAAYVNGSRAVAYLPYEEDSLGYVAMEAALAGRPLITVTDSGGVVDLVLDGLTGWVAPPTPEGLGEVLSMPYRSGCDLAGVGDAARGRLASFGLSWAHVIDRLVP
jgi:glycosyltransferase involved in cell wall biosynthesis